MTNASQANAAPLPAFNRRAALTGLAAAAGAIVAAPCIAKAAPAASAAVDPVFAAIERHNAALVRLNFACVLTDSVAAEQQGRTIAADDEAENAAANHDEAEAFFAVISTAPQTKAGARALIEYAGTLDDLEGVEEALPTFLATLLRSTLTAGEV